MAIAGAWLNANPTVNTSYGSALKQGTGANSIHGVRTAIGRNTAPGTSQGDVDATLVGDDDYGYCPEDSAYFAPQDDPSETGVGDRANWGTEESRGTVTADWPHWGTGIIPGGSVIRSQEHGAIAGNTPDVIPAETATQGWQNKQTGIVEDSTTSDPSQYEMRTSMTQRDKVRSGSQRGAGSDSDYDAPIKSRITGQKLKFWSGEDRHTDMAPKAQEQMIRPFWSRTGGTGYSENMSPNEMYQSTPLQRVSPPDAYQGLDTPVVNAGASYGYTDEDSTW